MKNYNDIYDMKQEVCDMINTAYSKGYDKAYHDRQIEEQFDEDKAIEIEEAYQKGLNDAWECAKKIYMSPEDGGLPSNVLSELFNTKSTYGIICNTTVDEAYSKITEYEKKKKADEEIKVGDEVTNTVGSIAIVTCIRDEKYIDIMFDNGQCNNIVLKSRVKKTGRHFDIPDILKQMRNEQ